MRKKLVGSSLVLCLAAWLLSSSGCAHGWIGTGTDPCPVMGEEAIVEYAAMVLPHEESQTEHFRLWMGQMILYCEAQDARLQ